MSLTSPTDSYPTDSGTVNNQIRRPPVLLDNLRQRIFYLQLLADVQLYSHMRLPVSWNKTNIYVRNSKADLTQPKIPCITRRHSVILNSEYNGDLIFVVPQYTLIVLGSNSTFWFNLPSQNRAERGKRHLT